MVVTKAGRLYGWTFRMERGATQGYPFSPIVFTIMVDAVVR